MSRTFRKFLKIYREMNKVRDGTPTKYSHSCENNGSCYYCKSNRLYKNNKKIDSIKQLYKDEYI